MAFLYSRKTFEICACDFYVYLLCCGQVNKKFVQYRSKRLPAFETPSIERDYMARDIGVPSCLALHKKKEVYEI